ncbi:hypothetical protein F1880_009247 [Penicillium rolfsii]|nr:hypothetical protein F1880_009247 [Penicillium rolfsii]
MKAFTLLLPLILGVQARTARRNEHGTIHDDIASPRDCARLCQNKPGCTESAWSTRNKCVIGGSGPLVSQTYALFMERISEPDPPAGDNPFEGPDECESNLAECEQRVQSLNAQLAACTSQQNVAQVQCNQHDGQTVRNRGKNWKVHCGKEATCLGGAQNIGTRDNLQPFISFSKTNKSCWVSGAGQNWDTCTLAADSRFDTVQLLQ